MTVLFKVNNFELITVRFLGKPTLTSQINEVTFLKEQLSTETSSNINNLNTITELSNDNSNFKNTITELSNDNNNLKNSNGELTKKVELENDYVEFGKLIEEISFLKNGTEFSTLHYFEELLNLFLHLDEESTSYFLLNEKLNPNNKIEIRTVLYEILSKLLSHEYIILDDQFLKETTNFFLSYKLSILFKYMNII